MRPLRCARRPGSRCLTPSFHGVCRAHFIQHLNHVWVCDSGKIGAFYLQLDRLTEGGDAELVAKAIAAGEFLLRMQLPSGDLSGSVYNTDNGTVTHRSYFAGTVSAVYLWAELYNTTGNATWIQVIPTPSHVLDRISPIFSPFLPVFCAFSPS